MAITEREFFRRDGGPEAEVYVLRQKFWGSVVRAECV